ncbi:MAG TPA: pyrroline-5-carboxylate reductase [Chloroflexota bacterium]|jgi:pyrroline-5-carboxylate reductase
MTESAGLPPIAFLGAGQMAEAFVRGLLRAEMLAPGEVWVSDIRPGRAHQLARDLGVNAASSNLDAVGHAELILVSVKPQDVPALLDEVGADVGADHLVISIAAGVTLSTLERRLPHHPPVIRVMPNTPALVQTGMAVLAPGTRADKAHEATALRLFGALGRAIVLPERHLDAVTALSGSGPAYLAVVAEALSDAGVRVGLPRDVAHLLAAQTMLGTGRMLADTGMHPALLKEAVASPGGTSIAGLHAMKRGGIRALIMDAIVAATERSHELGQAAGD